MIGSSQFMPQKRAVWRTAGTKASKAWPCTPASEYASGSAPVVVTHRQSLPCSVSPPSPYAQPRTSTSSNQSLSSAGTPYQYSGCCQMTSRADARRLRSAAASIEKSGYVSYSEWTRTSGRSCTEASKRVPAIERLGWGWASSSRITRGRLCCGERRSAPRYFFSVSSSSRARARSAFCASVTFG